MTGYRRFALGAVAWVVVVTAGAALVWTVISQAGAGVAGELPPTNTSAQEQQTSDQPSASTPPGTGPASSSPPSGRPEAQTTRRTWQGAAGMVVAACRGAAIDFVSAQPASGWSIEVEHTGPEDVRVEFEAGDAKVRVEGACVGGVPSFTVDD